MLASAFRIDSRIYATFGNSERQLCLPSCKQSGATAQIDETFIQEVGQVTVAVILKTDLFPHGKDHCLAFWGTRSVTTVQTVLVLNEKKEATTTRIVRTPVSQHNHAFIVDGENQGTSIYLQANHQHGPKNQGP